jgi:RNA polymerase sigma-70 factor (ECF subfamily)
LSDRNPTSDPELAQWISESRERLKRAVALRLDRRLASRVDPSDVVQEAMLEAATRTAEYRANPTMPPHLWLRLITIQRLALVHRQHLTVKARSVNREILPGALDRDSTWAGSGALAAFFVDQRTSPSQAAMRREAMARVQRALEELSPMDREMLALRHYEQLSNAESAGVLGISETAASSRYLRALKHLKRILGDVFFTGPGG